MIHVFHTSIPFPEPYEMPSFLSASALSRLYDACSLIFSLVFSQVGSHLKSPQLPIWVVLSESHFTCLFAADRRLCQQQADAGRFDLFYYDMLARQDDEIRLTVGQWGLAQRRLEMWPWSIGSHIDNSRNTNSSSTVIYGSQYPKYIGYSLFYQLPVIFGA